MTPFTKQSPSSYVPVFERQQQHSINANLWWSVITGAIALHLLAVSAIWFQVVRLTSATSAPSGGKSSIPIEFIELEPELDASAASPSASSILPAAPNPSSSDSPSSDIDLSAPSLDSTIASRAVDSTVAQGNDSIAVSPDAELAPATPPEIEPTLPTQTPAQTPAQSNPPDQRDVLESENSESETPESETIASNSPAPIASDTLPQIESTPFDPNELPPSIDPQPPVNPGNVADALPPSDETAIATNPTPTQIEARILSIVSLMPDEPTDIPPDISDDQREQTFALDPMNSLCLLNPQDMRYLGQIVRLAVTLETVDDQNARVSLAEDTPPQVMQQTGSPTYDQLAVCLIQEWQNTFVPPSSGDGITPELSYVAVELQITRADDDESLN
ncbi:MAG: hypothetical protein ACFE0J_09910 [Elainellaceae cyanobacterium]